MNDVIETQRKSWNEFSGGWKKHDDIIQRWMHATGEMMVEQAHLTDGNKVLDAATGTGEPGITAAQMYPGIEVTGSDVAEDMVTVANERAKELGISNFHAVIGASASLPFEDNAFDAVLSRYGVIFEPDVPTAMHELARVLKSGGRMVIASWAEPALNPWATSIPKALIELTDFTAPPPGAPGIFGCPHEDSISSIMESIGMTDVSVVDSKGTFLMESPQAFWDFMMEIAAPIAGAVRKLDAETTEKVHARALEILDSMVADGKLHVPYHARITSGTKG